MSDSSSPASAAAAAERHPRPALIAAGAVATVLLLQMLVGFIESWMFTGRAGAYLLTAFLPNVVFTIVPLAAGVFVVLFFWPVRSADGLPLVIAKAAVAAAAGWVLSAIVGAIWAVVVSGLRFADAGALSLSPFSGLLSGVLTVAPLVIAVVLVQWVIQWRVRE